MSGPPTALHLVGPFLLCKVKGRVRTGSWGAHTGSQEESEKGLVCT